jgi:predicted nucleotidyltransferase
MLHKELIQARDKIFKDAQKVLREKAIECHIFGSVARGDSDPYSDLDIWFTFKDKDTNEVIENRLKYYSQIGEIIHICEAPQNRPTDGIHSALLYKTSNDLLQTVDIYLCPISTSFVTKESKRIFGDIDLPQDELSFNTEKFIVDKTYRIDFIIGFTFTSIKRIARKEKGALEPLSREYAYLSERYDITVETITSRENSFANLRQIIANLKKVSNGKQMRALSEIESFSFKVEMARE